MPLSWFAVHNGYPAFPISPYAAQQRLAVDIGVNGGRRGSGSAYLDCARKTRNNYGDPTRYGKMDSLSGHHRLDHRDEHLVVVLQFNDCGRDGRRIALALRWRARLQDCAR